MSEITEARILIFLKTRCDRCILFDSLIGKQRSVYTLNAIENSVILQNMHRRQIIILCVLLLA